MRTLTEDDARRLIAEVASKAPPEFGLEEAMLGLIEIIASASSRLTEIELAKLIGSAGVVCAVAARAAYADAQAEAATSVKN